MRVSRIHKKSTFIYSSSGGLCMLKNLGGLSNNKFHAKSPPTTAREFFTKSGVSCTKLLRRRRNKRPSKTQIHILLRPGPLRLLKSPFESSDEIRKEFLEKGKKRSIIVALA